MQDNDFKEKVRHGDVWMPVRYYRCEIPLSFHGLSLHWHEETEFTYILEGTAVYDINFETFQAEEGDLLLISPHTLHSANEISGQVMVSDSLVFDLDMLKCHVPDACTLKYLSPIQNNTYRLVPVLKPNDAGYGELLECFGQLLRCFQKKEAGYELRVKECLFHFLFLLFQHGYVVKNNSSTADSQMEEKLKEVLSYIKVNYHRALSISELAEVSHFSPTYFMNFFKKLTGMTCVEYINHFRISMAAAALAQSHTGIMEIAMEHGFSNISYFNKMFKNRFGMTPKEYRKAQSAVAEGKNSGNEEGVSE